MTQRLHGEVLLLGCVFFTQVLLKFNVINIHSLHRPISCSGVTTLFCLELRTIKMSLYNLVPIYVTS